MVNNMKGRRGNFYLAAGKWLIIVLFFLSKETNAVDFQSPSGGMVCRVEEWTENRAEIIAIRFGRFNADSFVAFDEVGQQPLLRIEKEGGYPELSICYSPAGENCMIAFIRRKFFGIQIVDRNAKSIGIDIDKPIDAALKAFLEEKKQHPRLDARTVGMAYWVGDSRLKLIVEDSFPTDSEIEFVKYKVLVEKKKGDWVVNAAIWEKPIKP